MDCRDVQKSKLATSSTPSSAPNLLPEGCICIDASFSCSSPSGDGSSITLWPAVTEPIEQQSTPDINQHVMNTPPFQFVSSPAPLILSSGYDRPSPLLSAAKVRPPPPSRPDFMQIFVSTFLPQLKRIHSQNSSICQQAKFSAVRIAADMSLAMAAKSNSNNTWSRRLLGELSSNIMRVRRNRRLYPSSCRSKVYARILRRCNVSHAGCGRLAGRCEHAERCRRSRHARRMQHVMPKRQCGSGLSSYLRALRNTRAMERSARKAAAKPSKAQALSHVTKDQILRLGGLIPGGCSMNVPLLFQEAADYIRCLQMQVEALQALSCSVLY